VRLLSLAAIAACSLPLLASAPAAHASTALCRSVVVGTGEDDLYVCFDLGESGTTVAPVVVAQCPGMPSIGSKGLCNNPPQSVGLTGFVPNPSYPLPKVGALTGSVRVYDGDVGTLYAAGISQPVHVTGVCFGDPVFCA
jgi:hypothetical protein